MYARREKFKEKERRAVAANIGQRKPAQREDSAAEFFNNRDLFPIATSLNQPNSRRVSDVSTQFKNDGLKKKITVSTNGYTLAKLRGSTLPRPPGKGPHIGMDKALYSEATEKFGQLKTTHKWFGARKRRQEWANDYCLKKIDKISDPLEKQRKKNAIQAAYLQVCGEPLKLKYWEYRGPLDKLRGKPTEVTAPEEASGREAGVGNVFKLVGLYSAINGVKKLIKASEQLVVLIKGKNLTEWEGPFANIKAILKYLGNRNIWGSVIAIGGSVLGFVANIYTALDSLLGINNRFKWWQALRAAPKEKKWAAQAKYGARKVFRGLISQTGNFLRSLANIFLQAAALITAVIPVVSLSAQIGRIVIGLTDVVEKLFRSAKGFYKWVRGKRGKQRKEAAQEIVNAIAAGDRDAALLVHRLNPFGKLSEKASEKALLWKWAPQHRIRAVTQQKDPDRLIKKFELLAPGDKKKLVVVIAARLKST